MVFNLGASKTSQSSTSKTTQNQTQAGSQSAQGSTVGTTLDPQTIATLQGIIQTLAPGVGQSADAEVIRGLAGQLTTTLDPALVDANIKASQAAATRNFRMTQAPQIAQFQQQIGSKGNTFAQILEGQGNVDLATMLAQIETSGRLQGSAQQSANLGAAISGFGAASQVQSLPLQNLLASIATLTGARTTQDTTQQSLSNLVSNLTGQTDTKGSSTSLGGSFGF